jgi:hypothetical protein
MRLAGDDRAIELYDNAGGPNLQLLEEGRDTLSFQNVSVFTIELNSHGNKKTASAPAAALAREYGLKFAPAAQSRSGTITFTLP